MKPRERKPRVYIVPTRYGTIYGLMVMSFLFVGTAYDNNSVLVATALLVTFGLMCMHQTNTNVAQVEVESVEPESGFSGQSVSWKIRLKNKAPLTAFSINIRDAVLDIPASTTSIENIQVVLRKRGRVEMNRLKISSTYPFGLFYAWKFWNGHVQYYVYPRLHHEAIIPEGRHNDRTEISGHEDFIGHRDYIPGDSARHIDWKAQARQQKLVVKLFDTHQPDIVVLNLMDFSAHTTEEKLSQLATAVHECFKLQKVFKLVLPNEEHAPAWSHAHYEQCLRALAVYGEPHEPAA